MRFILCGIFRANKIYPLYFEYANSFIIKKKRKAMMKKKEIKRQNVPTRKKRNEKVGTTIWLCLEIQIPLHKRLASQAKAVFTVIIHSIDIMIIPFSFSKIKIK